MKRTRVACVLRCVCASSCITAGSLAAADGSHTLALLFRGFASNQWSSCLDANARETLVAACEGVLRRKGSFQLITLRDEVMQGEHIALEPHTTLGAAISIVRAGRVDYRTIAGIRPKYFLAVSFDVFDPITGYMLASFPQLAFGDAKQELQDITVRDDQRAYAQLMQSLTNAFLCDIAQRFHPAIMAFTAIRHGRASARIARPRAAGLGLNDILYDSRGTPFVISSIEKGVATVQPVDALPPSLPEQFTLYAKRIYAPAAVVLPMRVQVLMIDVPHDCPAAVHAALDYDDIEIGGALKLHTALADDGRIPLLYPAPLGVVTKQMLVRAANLTHHDKYVYLHKRARPDYVVIGRVLHATRHSLYDERSATSKEYFRMVVAADLCDIYEYAEPLLTCVAEDDFSELTTRYKEVNPQGVFTSLAQTAFEKAGRKLACALGTTALAPPGFRFDPVSGDLGTADRLSASQLAYAALLQAVRPDGMRIGFSEPVRQRFYQRYTTQFDDRSYYAFDEQRSALMERVLRARQFTPAGRIALHFDTATASTRSVAASATLYATRNGSRLWTIPVEGQRPVPRGSQPEHVLRQMIYDMCVFAGKKFETTHGKR